MIPVDADQARFVPPADISRRRAKRGDGAVLFSAWLRAQLRASRLSQRQLAGRAGVNHSTVSRLLRGARAPSYATAAKLARGLGLDGPALLEGDQPGTRRIPLATARVERALRLDDALGDAEIREVMTTYLLLRGGHDRKAPGAAAARPSRPRSPRAIERPPRTLDD